MTGDFRSIALSGRRVSQALPLIQTTWPYVDARAWHGYSQFFLARLRQKEAGIIAICDAADYLCGVLVYEVRPDLRAGQILAVPLFVAADLQNSTALIANLLETVRQKARELRCTGLQIHLHQEQPALRSRLQALGLSDQAEYLWERVAPVRSAH